MLYKIKGMLYDLRIELQGVKDPVVWRRVLVNSDYTFGMLHKVIQITMGWDFAHLYRFADKLKEPTLILDEEDDDDMLVMMRLMYPHREIKAPETVHPEDMKLEEYFQDMGHKEIFYTYDFGDDWLHRVTLKSVKKGQRLHELMPFKLIGGEGACPPEDCGGAPGYAMLKDMLLGKTDKSPEEVKMYCEWMGIENPEYFDPYQMHLRVQK